MSKLVECVPNFSEGRRPEVYEAIAAAVSARAAEGVRLIDTAPDPDHNRTVVTFVGPPAAAAEAAFDACAVATRLIDMERHQGDHPRIGATDVVPFIPVRGLEMAECVALARDLGRRIAGELGVPVYLYEEAALRPERRSLPDIRRGQYEGLKLAIATDPARAPDYGPPRLHPTAGATVVGARWPLIAFNVNLTTPDLSVARDIARTIRESSGGLPCLRAIGVFLAERNQAQVSMNLVNFRVTPIQTAFEAVRSEAEKRGVGVAGSEIIGLVPAEALAQAAAHFLKVEGFRPAQMLESYLPPPVSASTLADQALAEATAGLSRNDLLRWLGDASKLWLAHDGLWFRAVEKASDLEEAILRDGEAMAAWTVIEAKRVMDRLGLAPGGGLPALETALRARLYALLNRQEIRREGDRLIFTMLTCRVQDARNRQGLPPFPCREVGLLEYAGFARTIDPGLEVICRHCPPGDLPPGAWCSWEFHLREH